MRTLIAVTLIAALTGCTLPPAAPPVYSPDAYKAAEPRSEAFHTVCAKRGGHVVGQDCVTQSAGGSIIIPIFENETK
jgi:hypothetical protein